MRFLRLFIAAAIAGCTVAVDQMPRDETQVETVRPVADLSVEMQGHIPAAPQPPAEVIELRLREVVSQPATTLPGTQANPATTYWREASTTLNGVPTTTWIQYIYSQSFYTPTVAPSPASGSVGLGTLTGTVGSVATSTSKNYDVKEARAGKGMSVGMGAAVVVAGVVGRMLL